MNISQLLTTKKCSCGKEHSCDIQYVIIENGALQSLPSLCSSYANILIVADSNTFNVCGTEVANLLASSVSFTLIYECEGYLVPNEEAICKLQSFITPSTDLILGIGSGVIQDLCKYVSFDAHLPYFIVATAPSMDGYASKGAAMITDNMKVTYNAHVPTAIIGDVDILKDAPIDMIKSGYGDILGKFSCLNDWKLSRIVNDEYFCNYVYDLTFEMLNAVKDMGDALLRRDADAIKKLMEALVGVGVAMAYSGNSRPASGSEHHLSHFFEIVGIVTDTDYLPHGIDVAYSTVVTAKIREKLLNSQFPEKQYQKDEEQYKSDMKAIYKEVSDGCIALQKKIGNYEKDRVTIYRKKEKEVRAILAEMPKAEEIEKMLSAVRLDISEFYEIYTEEKINNSIVYAKDLKDRYTVLWMNYDFFGGKISE